MPDKPEFELILNPVYELKERFEAAGIIFFLPGEVPPDCVRRWKSQLVEVMLDPEGGLKDSCDMVFSEGGWAVTPSFRQDEEIPLNMIDILRLPPKRRHKRTTGLPAKLARPALRLVETEPDDPSSD